MSSRKNSCARGRLARRPCMAAHSGSRLDKPFAHADASDLHADRAASHRGGLRADLRGQLAAVDAHRRAPGLLQVPAPAARRGRSQPGSLGSSCRRGGPSMRSDGVALTSPPARHAPNPPGRRRAPRRSPARSSRIKDVSCTVHLSGCREFVTCKHAQPRRQTRGGLEKSAPCRGPSATGTSTQ